MLEFLKTISRRLLKNKCEEIKAGIYTDHDQLVEQARQEWQEAQTLFNQVKEDDLIDYAIYKLKAAERRYIFLLHESRCRHAGLQKELTEGGSPDQGN